MRWVYGGGLVIIAATFIADIGGLPVDYWRAAAWSLTLGAGFVSFFTVRYAFWSNWRSNDIGRILLTKSILQTAMLWQIVATTWIGQEYPFRNEIRFVIYAVFALSYITMDVALLRKQRRDHAHRE